MDELAQRLLLIALGCLFSWFALIRSVYWRLESHHPDLFCEWGKPSADNNHSKTTLAGLWGLIGKRGHRALSDRTLSWRCDLALLAYGSSVASMAFSLVLQWVL